MDYIRVRYGRWRAEWSPCIECYVGYGFTRRGAVRVLRRVVDEVGEHKLDDRSTIDTRRRKQLP